MRDLYRNRVPCRDLASRFKIAPCVALRIINGNSWAHVPGAVTDKVQCIECFVLIPKVKGRLCDACRTKADSDGKQRVKAWFKEHKDRVVKYHKKYQKAYDAKSRGDIERWARRAMHHFRKRSPVPTDLTAEYLIDLYYQQDGRCALTGDAMVPFLKMTARGVDPNSLSVDRVEPEKGYVVGNVRLVTYRVNQARGAYPEDEFVEMCVKVLMGPLSVYVMENPQKEQGSRR